MVFVIATVVDKARLNPPTLAPVPGPSVPGATVLTRLVVPGYN